MHTTRLSWTRAATAAAALALAVLPGRAAADWPASGRNVTPLPATQQHSVSAPDGADGAIIAWQDFRTPHIGIFAQHVRATGGLDPAWPAGGRALLGDAAALAGADGGQFTPEIVSDGAGGAIVVWQDLRSPVTETDLFAQHVLATGVVDPAWPVNGLAVTTATGLQNLQALATDGKGGAIVTWVDTRFSASQPDIFAQHVESSGVVDAAWPANGLAVCTAPGAQGFPVLIADGLGGAIVAWNDDRAAVTTGFDIFAQHVQSSGNVDPAWPVNGVAVCSATGDQARPTIVSDGTDGAVIAWADTRVALTSHIFAQHVFGTGGIDRAWPVNGRQLSGAAASESRPLAVADGAGGAVVNWLGFTVELNMYAQHVKSTGVVDPAWPAGGLALTDSDRQQTHAQIVADGAGGAVVAWQDSDDVVAQHVLGNGTFDPVYPATGRLLDDGSDRQGDPSLVPTSGGGAIATWTDGRNGTDVDIFAMQVEAAGTVDVPPGSLPTALAFAPPSPNPSRTPLSLSFTLPRVTLVRLAIFDATGRRVRALLGGVRPAGGQSVPWDLRDDQGAAVRPGVYFARLDAEGRAITRKLIRVQ